MSYEVLARKWRPQRFADVVGQEHVVATLSRAILANRVAHAYLLVGPRGTGKTTTARLFAKALNCQNRGANAEPCGVCDSCREITAGTSLDVIEIDGASNNNVDQIRDLRDNVRYAPARGPFKIYIIDEVHMLSIGAFNALLKTLEEPPPHAKFLLATTDVHKVPVTILSRCQRFDLRRIGLRDIVGRLREIATAEGWTVDEAALAAIARGAEGGLRDAESALDQIISFRGTTIAEQDVLDVFGLVSWTTLEELSAAVLQNRPADILRILADLDEGGRDLQQLLKELTAHIRNLLVHLYAPSMDSTFDLTPPQLEAIQRQAALSDGEKLLRVMDILADAASQMRFSLARRATMEVALLKAARAASLVSIDTLIARVQELPGALPLSPGGTQLVASAPPARGVVVFPCAAKSSTPWNPNSAFFHAMEVKFAIFPRHGTQIFKKFHAMEPTFVPVGAVFENM
jgi:DNA polymerase-3 subunit gamma/tau